MPVLAGRCVASNRSRKLLISLNSLRWLLRRDARTGSNGLPTRSHASSLDLSPAFNAIHSSASTAAVRINDNAEPNGWLSCEN